MPVPALIGAGVGILGGIASGHPQAGSGDGGNVFSDVQNPTGKQTQNDAYNSINSAMEYSPNQAAKDVQGNPVYSGLFGNGGSLQNAEGQLSNEANQGFSLTPGDMTAYGQASGDITRQFGQHDQSLSQALSDRGLSNSGVAGAGFESSLGNKNEQLAGLQTQIAQQRMQFNQHQMAQTQDFISQLGAQGQGAIGQAMNEKNTQSAEGTQWLTDQQNQSNNNFNQQRSGDKANPLSSAISGGMAGMSAMKGMFGDSGGFLGSPLAGTGNGAAANGTYNDKIVNSYNPGNA